MKIAILNGVAMIKPYYETELGQLYCGNCLEILPQLEADSIDLIVTDPPYRIHAKSGGGLHNKRDWLQKVHKAGIDEFEPSLFMEVIEGSLKAFHAYIFCSKDLLDEYIGIFKEKGLQWELLIYAKNNPIPTKNNKYLSDKEYCFFVRSKGKCYFNNEAPYKKYYTVQNINVTTNEFHPAEKDMGFIQDRLLISTLPDDHVVLDPFIGSGTTAVACERLERKWIGVELSKEYCDIAVKRIEEERSQLKLI